MSIYLITYDLMAPGKDYNKLFDAIKKLGSWFHCLDSTWIVDKNRNEVLGCPLYGRQNPFLVCTAFFQWNRVAMMTE